MNLETIVIFLLAGSTAVIGNILLKLGMKDIGNFELSASALLPILWRMVLNWQVVLGMALYVFSSFLYLKLIASLEVTKIYPMLVAYMFVVLLVLGASFLREAMTVTKLVGTLIIILGIFLASK